MNLIRVIINLFRFNRTNWKAVAGCFLAAAVFWLFNALNKNYSTNVRFPLQFEFDRKRFVASQSLPQDIYLNVSGKGWDLMRKVLGVKLPSLIIPLERPVEIKKIVGSSMPPLLAGQIGTLKINHVMTDTLYLSIEPKDSARFKLVADVSGITYRNGYGRISPIVVLPDSVQLIGPKSALKKLPDSLVMVLPRERLSENFREEIEVSIGDNIQIRRNPPVVEVIFEVGQIIETTKKIKLVLVNVANPSSVMQQSDSLNIHFQIPQSRVMDFEQLSMLRAVIDLKDFKRGQRKVIPVVTGLPDYVKVITPDSVQLKLY